MYHVGPATKLITLTEIQQLFGLSAEGVSRLLGELKIPVLLAEDDTQSGVLAMSLEIAMLGRLLPGGMGVDATETAHRGIDLASFTAGLLPHWDAFRDNPVQLTLLGALGALLYGHHDEDDLKRRLWALGDLLITEATRKRSQSNG